MWFWKLLSIKLYKSTKHHFDRISIYNNHTQFLSICPKTINAHRNSRNMSSICLKIGYIPNYSHLIGIMISKTIGFRGTLFSDTPICSRSPVCLSPGTAAQCVSPAEEVGNCGKTWSKFGGKSHAKIAKWGLAR